MADAVVRVVNGRAIVQVLSPRVTVSPAGSALLAPLVSAAQTSAANAAASQTAAEAAAASIVGLIVRNASAPYDLTLADLDGYVYGGLAPGVLDVTTWTAMDASLLGLTTGLSLMDGDGYYTEALNAAGQVPGPLLVGTGATFDNFAIQYGSVLPLNTGLSLVDTEGYYIEVVSATGDPMAPAASSTSDADLYGLRDAANLSASTALKSQIISPAVAGLLWDYVHLLAYGQSLSNGTEGWPALSKTQPYSNVTVGGSVRGAATGTSAFSPVGGSSAFATMVATVQATSGAQLSDAAVAALSPGDGARGETQVEGALNGLKALHNAGRGVADDLTRVLVGSAMGVGGKTIAQLSKGASPDLWTPLVQVATAAKSNATGLSKSYGVGAFLWEQGENDSGTAKATYKASFVTMLTDLATDIVTGVAGQTKKVPAFLSGVSPNGRSDGNGTTTALNIDMAQLELSREVANVFLVGPSYHVPDKGIHLTSNGYRWLANILAKVLYRVLVRRQPWKPLSPRLKADGTHDIVLSGKVLSIGFDVPEPPLAFDTPYVGLTATDYTAKGFTVRDTLGVVGVNAVRIVGSTIVELTLSRVPTGATWLQYAGVATFAGHGCLRDSDPFVSPDLYEYTGGSGQAAGENIAALVGKPYPNQNWAVPFNLQIQA